MEENKNTAKKISGFALFSILIMAVVWTFESAALNPALGLIQTSFPNEPTSLITFISTVPLITALIFSTISGRLANRYNKKKIAVFGLLLYGVSGMIPAFLHSLIAILVLRFFTGIGVGLVLPIPTMYVAELFEGVKRQKMMGYLNTVMNAFDFVLCTGIGLLLGFGWQVSFYSFALILVVMLIVIIGCPNSQPNNAVVEAQSHKEKIRLPGYAYKMFFSMFLLWLAFASFCVTLSMYIIHTHLVPVQAIGIYVAVPGGCSAIAALLFHHFTKYKYRFIATALLVFSGSFFAIAHATNPVILMVACIMLGFGQGILVPYVSACTAENIPLKAVDMSMGFVQAGIQTGALIGGFLISAIMSLSKDNPFGFAYNAYAIAILVVAVIFFIISFAAGKKDKEPAPAHDEFTIGQERSN